MNTTPSKWPYTHKPWLMCLWLWMLLFSMACSWAGDEEGGFVWQIEKTGQPKSYLVGTVHLGKTGSRLSPRLQTLLQQNQVLVVESNDADWEGSKGLILQQQMGRLMAAEVPLKQSLGAKRLAAMNHSLAKNGSSIRLQGDAKMAPWMAWMLMETDYNMPGYSMQAGIDVLLLQAAHKRKMRVVALETLEPMYVFKRIPNAVLLRGIDADLAYSEQGQKEQLQMLQHYHQGDSKALIAKVLDAEDSVSHYPKQDRLFWRQWMFGDLLQQRNVAWMPKLVGQIKQGPTVIAVGAAHLYGGSGLIVLLRERGYQVTPYRI